MCVHACRKVSSGKNIAIPEAELSELVKLPISKDKIRIVVKQQVGAGNCEFPQKEWVEKYCRKAGGKKQGKVRLRINALFECHRSVSSVLDVKLLRGAMHVTTTV